MALLARRNAIGDNDRRAAFQSGNWQYDPASGLGLTYWNTWDRGDGRPDRISGDYLGSVNWTPTNVRLINDQPLHDSMPVAFRPFAGVAYVQTSARPMHYVHTHGRASMSFWYKRLASNDKIHVSQRDNANSPRFFIGPWDNGIVFYQCRASTAGGGFEVSDSSTDWHHVAMVINLSLAGPAGMKCYFDGVDQNNATITPSSGVINTGLTAFGWLAGSDWSNGRIADLRVSNESWSAEQVEQIYAQPWKHVKPIRSERRYYSVPLSSPAFPVPDNAWQVMPRPDELFRFASSLPVDNPSTPTSACTPGTKPEGMSLITNGITFNFNSGENYSAADWAYIARMVNNTHVLNRVSGDLYRKVEEYDVGTSPIRITWEVDLDTDGSMEGTIMVKSTGGAFTDYGTRDTDSASAPTPPYDCGAQVYDNFTFGETIGTLPPEGGIQFPPICFIDLRSNAAPPPSGDGVWSYDENSLTDPDNEWAFERSQLPSTNPSSRPEGNDSWAGFLATPGWGNPVGTSDLGIRFPLDFEVPEMQDAAFIAEAYSNAVAGETQITPGVDTMGTQDAFYLLPTPYRWQYRLNFEVLGDAGDWDPLAWAIPIDFLRQDNPTGWVGTGDGETGPSIAFYLYPLVDPQPEWGWRIAGADSGEIDWSNPSNSNLVEGTRDASPGIGGTGHGHLGRHELVIEFELDATGVNSYTGIWLDGRLFVEDTGHNAFFSADPNYHQMLWSKIGNYHSSSGQAGQQIKYTDIQIYRVAGTSGAASAIVGQGRVGQARVGQT